MIYDVSVARSVCSSGLRSRLRCRLAAGAIAALLTLGACQKSNQAADLSVRSLTVVGPTGNPAAQLGADENGTRLALCDESGIDRVVLLVTSDGDSSSLCFLDEAGRERLTISLISSTDTPKGASSLELHDSYGTRRVFLGARDAISGFALRDSEDRMRYSLVQQGDGAANMTLLGEHLEVEWSAPEK